MPSCKASLVYIECSLHSLYLCLSALSSALLSESLLSLCVQLLMHLPEFLFFLFALLPFLFSFFSWFGALLLPPHRVVRIYAHFCNQLQCGRVCGAGLNNGNHGSIRKWKINIARHTSRYNNNPKNSWIHPFCKNSMDWRSEDWQIFVWEPDWNSPQRRYTQFPKNLITSCYASNMELATYLIHTAYIPSDLMRIVTIS